MRHLIVGTAGHIDHGKSALVLALTGTDPDRLPEERERGITIDLGFADLDLGNGRVLSFVDVPGHERFVRHMVAGATGIDCVLLVVAADDGVRPQTREHVAICELLGVRHAIAVLTKSDLLEPELREVAELELREFLSGTSFNCAPVVRVSSRTGEGLDTLGEHLAKAFEFVPERAVDGVARLPVDRSFVLRGFGTVVTGTMASGTLTEGQEIEILPGGGRGRIRGLQVHHHRVSEVRAGQRAAVNLQGLRRDEAPRGATLSRPGTIPVTRRVWARVRMLPGAPVAFRRGGPVRFHQGTSDRAAWVRFLGPFDGVEAQAEIVLREAAVLLPGDTFILRRPAPVDTIGGGVIEDVRPPSRRARSGLPVVAVKPDVDALLLDRLARAGAAGRESEPLAGEVGLSTDQIAARIDNLVCQGSVVKAGTVVILATAWTALQERVVHELADFHRAEPLRIGMSREDLRSRTAREVSKEVWRAVLDTLAKGGEVRLTGERAALASHEVRLEGDSARAAQRLEAVFREAALDPPDPEDAVKPEGRAMGFRVLGVLEAAGRLVRIRDGRFFHTEALETLR